MTEATKPPEDGAVVSEDVSHETIKQEMEESLKHDPRLAIYKKADALKAEKERKEKESEEAVKEESATAPPETTPPEKGKEEKAKGDPDESEEGEAGEKGTPKIFTRAEFIEHFGDIRIKDKIAGEDLDAPVGDWVKAMGLEKHYQKRLQKLSQKEREILDRQTAPFAAGTDTPPLAIPGVSEEEIQRRYDELYAESPYKAQQFLSAASAKREEAKRVLTAQRAERALVDFRDAYPEATEDDYEKMNNPTFYEKYREIVDSRDRGDYFATLVAAYTRLRQEQLESERDAFRKERDKRDKDTKDKIDAKKKGTVLRQGATAPPQKTTTNEYKPESRQEYIARLAQKQRERMGLSDKGFRPR